MGGCIVDIRYIRLCPKLKKHAMSRSTTPSCNFSSIVTTRPCTESMRNVRSEFYVVEMAEMF